MINVTLIPILSDNYAYLIQGDNGQTAILDPGDAAPIIKTLEQKNLKPDQILLTHHHWDHTDGVGEMLNWHPCPVAGPAAEQSKIKIIDILFDENADFFCGGEPVQIIETPGHTPGHICLYFPESGVLFSGDTLFSMGCGRLFEGTAQDMYASMQKLKALPDDTKIYCGHEYTLNNAKFCAAQAPKNIAIQTRLKTIQNLREKNTPTIPFTLKEEKETNLFLMAESVKQFAHLRSLKDQQ